MQTYRAVVIGCSRMGGFIDNEVVGRKDFVLPYSHAAGYEAVERTELVGCADLRVDVMAEFGRRYSIPPERQYTDYRELLRKERPDIVSIATQPEQRAEIIKFACENGARAIYCEKALCASMAEADAIHDVVTSYNVPLNMGTNRRWHPGYEAMRTLIHSGELGELRSVIAYNAGSLFNTASHMFDVLQYLNGDHAPVWVHARLTETNDIFSGEILTKDPSGQGSIGFANGVVGYALATPRPTEFEAVCSLGTVTAQNNGARFVVRRTEVDEGRYRRLSDEQVLAFEPASATKRLIEDLVHSLDTGESPRGGVGVARTNTEIIFGFIESHRRSGAVVPLPLQGSTIRLQRTVEARQPRLGA